MAVVDRKSNQITNRDAVPRVANNGRISGAPVLIAKGYIDTIASGDSTGSIFRMCEIPSNAVVHKVEYNVSALAGSTAMDVGIYKSTKDGGAVVDADLFASAVAVASALNTPGHITSESGQYAKDEQLMPLWQVLGLSADPNTSYDVCCTLTADTAANGNIGIHVYYSV